MSSSSASTRATRAPHPPKGWLLLDDMDRSDYWNENPGDVKDMLKKDYGLDDANPIWVHDPNFGNILFIFQATPQSGGTFNYVWNDVERNVCRITKPVTLEEIRESIEKFGGSEGTFDALDLEEFTPP